MKNLVYVLLIPFVLLTLNSCEEDVPNPNPDPNTGTNTGTQCILDDCAALAFTVTYSGTNLFNSADGNYYSMDGSTNYCVSRWNPSCDTALMWDLSDDYNDSKAELEFNMDGTKDIIFTFYDDDSDGDDQDLYLFFKVHDVASFTVNQPYSLGGAPSLSIGELYGYMLPEGICYFQALDNLSVEFTLIDIPNKIFEGVMTATQNNCSTDSDGAYVIEIDFSCDID
tara:strand:+ start:113 stop:787 length:675 start_codon:yes stop_codon:yes gene_type:complete